MSHVTDVKLKVKDLDCVEETLAEQFPQCELRRNKTHFTWYERWMNDFHGNDAAVTQGRDPKKFGQCDHTIGIKGNNKAYEVGLVSDGAGGYDLLYDTWDGKLEPILGRGLQNFRKEYAAKTATKKAVDKLSRHGWRVTREELPTGAIRLKLKKR